MPLMSGSRRSINVTSGRCSRNMLDRLPSGGRLGHQAHVGLAVDDGGDALAEERMIVNAEDADVVGHDRSDSVP